MSALITAQTVWLLMVVAPGGLTSLQSVHTTLSECDAHRSVLQQNISITLSAQCHPIELQNGS